MSSSTTPGIARNTFINLFGQVVPLAAALVAMPRLIHALGTDRFGVLSLAWLVIGYFSIFDLGLGRALTQIVAERMASGRCGEVPSLFWSAIGLMAVMGILGAAIAFGGSHLLATDVLKIPLELQAESISTFRWLAVSIPVVVVTAGLVGMLTAYHRFDIINIVRVPLGLSNYLLPLLLISFSHSLIPITIVLVVTRVISALVYFVACLRIEPRLRDERRVDRKSIHALFRFGSWMTLSNIISPVMVYMDRFFIGAAVSVTAVAYYTTPYEALTKMLIFPATIAGVLFPLLAAASIADQARGSQLVRNGLAVTFFAMSLPLLVLTCFAHELLGFWLGEEFAVNGAPVLRWLAVGVLVNGLAQILFAAVQGAGRSDQTAKLHLIELVIYVPALWWAVNTFGIVGAAIVWMGRAALDAALLLFITRQLFSGSPVLTARVALLAGVGITLTLTTASIESLSVRVVVFCLLSATSLLLAARNPLFLQYLRRWREPKVVA